MCEHVLLISGSKVSSKCTADKILCTCPLYMHVKVDVAVYLYNLMNIISNSAVTNIIIMIVILESISTRRAPTFFKWVLTAKYVSACMRDVLLASYL